MTQVKTSKYTAQQIVETVKLFKMGKYPSDIEAISGIKAGSIYYFVGQSKKYLALETLPESLSPEWRKAIAILKEDSQIVDTKPQQEQPAKEVVSQRTEETEINDPVERLDQGFEGLKHAIVGVVDSVVKRKTEEKVQAMNRRIEKLESDHLTAINTLKQEHKQELEEKESKITELQTALDKKGKSSLKGLLGGIVSQ